MIKTQDLQKQINLIVLDILQEGRGSDPKIKKLEELMEQFGIVVENDQKFWKSIADGYSAEVGIKK
jgi:hypothetical protein